MGTPERLIQRLTIESAADPDFLSSMLLTYRSFASAEEFLDLLIRRFNIAPPSSLSEEELEAFRLLKQTPIRFR